jgi:alpha-L-rhamnosidase
MITRRHAASLVLALGVGVPALASGSVTAMTRTAPFDLKVEYATQPIGLDIAAPRLMWKLPAGQQRAYEVQVTDDGHVVWDSGKVAGADAPQAVYAGPTLASRHRYEWRVRTWNTAGRPSAWSATAWWEMGVLDRREWTGQWIGGRTRLDHDWSDLVLTTDFTLTGHALDVLFRARPIGKTFGEAYVWRIEATGGQAALLEQVRHYPGGTSSATTTATLKRIPLPDDFAGRRHRLVITAKGGAITTAIDGTQIDSLQDSSQASGTVGFSASEPGAATVHAVSVTGSGADDFATDFAGGDNPFSGGRTTADGLALASLELNKDIVLPIGAPAPLLRRAFEADHGPVAQARLYVAGAGWPKLSLNGTPVGASALASGFTDYSKRVLTRAYDVTTLVRPGRNALAAELGRGWYGLAEPNEWYFHQAPWRAEPALLAQLEIAYRDGTRQIVATDDAWKTVDGPTLHDSLHAGERYDARREIKGWQDADFDDAGWASARLRPGPTGALVDASMEPIAPLARLTPQSVKAIAPGVYVFDFGRIFAGRLNLTVSGPAGQTVSLVQGEKLKPDGSVEAFNRLVDSQMQTDRYTLSGQGVERWSPSFSYKGFRYVQVEGFPREPTLASLSGERIHSDVASTGAFDSSDPLLNAIQSAARDTLLNNMDGYQTDTPTYEKNGWTGDAQASAQAAILNFDVARVWTKWLADFRDSQSDKGEVPEIVPSTPLYGYENTPGWAMIWGPTPSWDAATFVLPQAMYEQYGDVRVLERMFETQKRLVDYTATYITAPDFRYDRGLGEYGAPAYDGGVDATASAYFFYMVDQLARNAGILGRAADAARYHALAGQVREAYNRKYWDAPRGLYRTLGPDGQSKAYAESQNVLPLAFGMVPGGQEQAVADHLAEDLKARGYRPGVGVYGAKFLLGLLTDHGHADVAYRVATQTSEPSWGWWIKNGLSTMPEGWALASRSYDHHYFGSISAWFYQSLAGIRPAKPGYGEIDIRPVMPEGLDHASASIVTLRGKVASSWRRDGDGVIQTVEIPGGSVANVRVACPAAQVTRSAGQRSDGPAHETIFQVGPGRHEFACKGPLDPNLAPSRSH